MQLDTINCGVWIHINGENVLFFNMCEFATTRLHYLKNHKNSKNVGIRYPCDICE